MMKTKRLSSLKPLVIAITIPGLHAYIVNDNVLFCLDIFCLAVHVDVHNLCLVQTSIERVIANRPKRHIERRLQ